MEDKLLSVSNFSGTENEFAGSFFPNPEQGPATLKGIGSCLCWGHTQLLWERDHMQSSLLVQVQDL